MTPEQTKRETASGTVYCRLAAWDFSSWEIKGKVGSAESFNLANEDPQVYALVSSLYTNIPTHTKHFKGWGNKHLPGMVAHAYNPSIEESERRLSG